MQKYGVENVNDHFIAFNTICDATQVSVPFPTYMSICTNQNLTSFDICDAFKHI